MSTLPQQNCFSNPSYSPSHRSLTERFIESLERHVDRLVVQRHKASGLCPFHEDHNPSFTANLNKNVWWCFVCARGGGVRDFAMAVGEQWSHQKQAVSPKPLSPARVHQIAFRRAEKAFEEWSNRKHRELIHKRCLLDIDRDIAEIAFRATVRRPDLYLDEEHDFWSRKLGGVHDTIMHVDSMLERLVVYEDRERAVQWWRDETKEEYNG